MRRREPVSVHDDGESLRLEAYEAERWHRLVELLLDRTPEIRPDPADDDRVVSPGWVWCRVVGPKHSCREWGS